MNISLWSRQEDQLLIRFYEQTSVFKRWQRISQKFLFLGIQKTSYHCRERYINRLDPDLKVEAWSNNEIRELLTNYKQKGSKWNKIQALIPHRTQNQLKNKFYSFLRCFLLRISKNQQFRQTSEVYCFPSKLIKMIYEGKYQFQKFKNRIWEYLEFIDYQIGIQQIRRLVKNNCNQLKQIFKLIRGNSLDLTSKNHLNYEKSLKFQEKMLGDDRRQEKRSTKLIEKDNIEKYFQFSDLYNEIVGSQNANNCYFNYFIYPHQEQASRVSHLPQMNPIFPEILDNFGMTPPILTYFQWNAVTNNFACEVSYNYQNYITFSLEPSTLIFYN